MIAAILGDDGDTRRSSNHDAAIRGRQIVSVNSTGLASVSILRYRRAPCRHSRGPYLWLRPSRHRGGPAMWIIRDRRRQRGAGFVAGKRRETEAAPGGYIASKYAPPRRRDISERSAAFSISSPLSNAETTSLPQVRCNTIGHRSRVTKMPRAGEPARGRNALKGLGGAELSAPNGQTRLAALYSIAQRENGRPEGRVSEARSDRALQFGTTRLR